MKISYKYVAALALVAGVGILSACGGSGGGSSGAVATGYGVVGASGTSGYVGSGTWSGQLIINNQPLYVQFLVYNNLCYGQSCSAAAGYLNLQMSTASNCGGSSYQTGMQPGMLPGPVQFVIRNYINGNQGQMLNACGDGFINSGNNGILVNYNNPNGTAAFGINGGYNNQYGYNNGYNQYPQNQVAGVPMLQINTQWTDGTHMTLNAQVIYQGQQIASGQIIGNGGMQGGYGTQQFIGGQQFVNSGVGYGGYQGYAPAFTTFRRF